MHRHFDEELNGVMHRIRAVFQHVQDTYPHPFLVSLRHTRITLNTGSGVWITRKNVVLTGFLFFIFSILHKLRRISSG